MTAPALVPLNVAADELGIGRTLAYKLVATGQIAAGVPVFRIGSKWMVTRHQLDRLKEQGLGQTDVLPVVQLPDPLTPSAVEQARRSIVMLTRGAPSGLDRESAVKLLDEVQRLQARDRRFTEMVDALRALLAAAETGVAAGAAQAAAIPRPSASLT